MRNKVTYTIAFTIITMIAKPLPAVVQYQITDLGIGRPRSISDTGFIVGEAGGHAIIFDPSGEGANIDLGKGCAYSVNNSGAVVGFLYEGGAFLYTDGVIHYLTGLREAFGINNRGEVVGYRRDSSLRDHAVIWYPQGQYFDLDPYSRGEGINDLGQVLLGSAIWQKGEPLINLDEAGEAGYFHINNLTQTVGRTLYREWAWHACLWENGVMTDLGSLRDPLDGESIASGINDLGQIVGSSDCTGSYIEGHAFLWEDGVMYDLNNLIPFDEEWKLGTASAINNLGWIVCGGSNSLEGEEHALLLKPIPEPTTLSLLGLGSLALLRKQRS